MKAELRYFEACPNWEEALADLRSVLAQLGWSGEVTLTTVDTPEEAVRLGFHGSPSIVIDGEDPFIDASAPVGLSCRVYRTPDGLQGSPGRAALRKAISAKA